MYQKPKMTLLVQDRLNKYEYMNYIHYLYNLYVKLDLKFE